MQAASQCLAWHLPDDAKCLTGLSDRPPAYLLWGPMRKGSTKRGTAQRTLTEPRTLSPLSARRGFFGSLPFSRCNDWCYAKAKASHNTGNPGDIMTDTNTGTILEQDQKLQAGKRSPRTRAANRLRP